LEVEAVTIAVTAEDIANGDPGNCSTCPVALAISRETGLDASFLDVDQEEIIIDEGQLTCPIVVQQFISRFDNGKPVDPFTFELPIEP